VKRVSIERIVIDANALEERDAEWLRKRLEGELQILLAAPGALENKTPESRTNVDAGELSASPGAALPRLIAEKVMGSLEWISDQCTGRLAGSVPRAVTSERSCARYR
jgi:hypothetical protein